MPVLASHQVVVAVAQALVAASLGEVDRFNRARTFSAFPGLKVYAEDEDLQEDQADVTWPATRLHNLQLRVDYVTRDPADLEGALATGAAAVLVVLEGAMELTVLPGVPNVRLRCTRMSRRVATEGEAVTGTVSLFFEVLFQVESNDPHTIV